MENGSIPTAPIIALSGEEQENIDKLIGQSDFNSICKAFKKCSTKTHCYWSIEKYIGKFHYLI